MEIKSELSNNELTKVAKLILKASQLGMDISGYGFADVNNNSGNVYLWLEDYPFCLYIAPFGNYQVMANWSCPYDGEEFDRLAGNSLDKLYKWCNKLQANSDKKEGNY